MKIFLFAHQDDEVFALPYILNSEKKLFIYLTSGVSVDSSKSKLLTRSSEAKDVFQRYLAELNSEVVWWGLDSSIPEGALYKFVTQENFSSILRIVKAHDQEIIQLVTTTFEGAHQDHDASAVITRKLAKVLGVQVVEVSTYPQWFSKFYSYKVMKPQHPDKSLDFSRGKTVLLALRLIKGYRTQRLTWLGLGLSTLGTYTFRKHFSAIPIEAGPMSKCFYELRGRAKQEDVLKHLLGPIQTSL
jgi:hypothetical protein